MVFFLVCGNLCIVQRTMSRCRVGCHGADVSFPQLLNTLTRTLKAPNWQVKPGECWDEDQGKGGRQELPAPATHYQHPLDQSEWKERWSDLYVGSSCCPGWFMALEEKAEEGKLG